MATRRPSQQRNVDDEPVSSSRYTFTPCTSLSMLTLSSNSTSVNNGRTKYFTCELKRPEQSLQDRMDRAIYGKQDHPNLSMVLGTTQRIRMESNNLSDEEMESEEDDAICFSSPDASPERDEATATFDEWMEGRRRLDTIVDNDDDDDDDLFAELDDEQDQDEFLDTSGNWLNEIYHDDTMDMILHDDHHHQEKTSSTRPFNNDEDENRPPRQWLCHKHLTKKILSIPTERSPLQELSTKSPSDDDDDKPARKRAVNNHRQSVRIMRSLSPPGRRDKGKRPAAY
ncbi:predicted protein [Lichtheimia corymbifera JMRC:FSU:9682]|uniref:Uncharacterized protein n=1 Tax=Lichtheimia corymbifera JMRC:FSU:9682 TaxID=1263082 RepID=A0A068RNN2_9FUNG|nr:predicted protein [Lichtheimia corymbifera JMRC:FSU:9682]